MNRCVLFGAGSDATVSVRINKCARLHKLGGGRAQEISNYSKQRETFHSANHSLPRWSAKHLHDLCSFWIVYVVPFLLFQPIRQYLMSNGFLLRKCESLFCLVPQHHLFDNSIFRLEFLLSPFRPHAVLIYLLNISNQLISLTNDVYLWNFWLEILCCRWTCGGHLWGGGQIRSIFSDDLLLHLRMTCITAYTVFAVAVQPKPTGFESDKEIARTTPTTPPHKLLEHLQAT